MFMRPESGITLQRLATEMNDEHAKVLRVDVPLHDVEFHLDAEQPIVKIGDREVPATPSTLHAFGDLLDVPRAFQDRLAKRAPAKVHNDLLDSLFTGYGGSQGLTFRIGDHGDGAVMGISTPGQEPVNPARLVEMAGRVLDTADAPVERLVNTSADFSFDVRVPEQHSRGVGGDFQVKDGLRVGDITSAGIRVGVDLKHGLAPWVEPWSYRLWCTNGCGSVDTGLRVDARGQTWEETLAEFEQVAERAFSRAESQIEHFYQMREQRVANPERTLRAIGREQGIPARSISALMDLAPTDLPDNPSMFDIVNLVTNFANSPTVTRDGGRLILERAGGNVVAEDAHRCGHCNQKVNA